MKQQEAAAHALAERNAELETARSSFSSAELHSPVSGFIVARKGEPGQSNAVSHGCPVSRFRQINVLNTASARRKA